MKTKKARTLEPLLTQPQLAALLNVSEVWLKKARKEKGFPVVKLGDSVRYRPSDVQAWMDKANAS